jgi:hypothetical protein
MRRSRSRRRQPLRLRALAFRADGRPGSGESVSRRFAMAACSRQRSTTHEARFRGIRACVLRRDDARVPLLCSAQGSALRVWRCAARKACRGRSGVRSISARSISRPLELRDLARRMRAPMWPFASPLRWRSGTPQTAAQMSAAQTDGTRLCLLLSCRARSDAAADRAPDRSACDPACLSAAERLASLERCRWPAKLWTGERSQSFSPRSCFARICVPLQRVSVAWLLPLRRVRQPVGLAPIAQRCLDAWSLVCTLRCLRCFCRATRP